MSPKQLKWLQIFIILFLSCLTLYMLFNQAQKEEPPFRIVPQEKKQEKKQEKQQKKQQEQSDDSSQRSLQAPRPIENNDRPSTQVKTVPIQRKLTQKQKTAIETFREQAQSILDRLPYQEDLQKLEDNQVHSIPQSLLQTGRDLGKLKELVLMYPDFQEMQQEAKIFYKDCADQEGYPTSIRSLCLFNRLQLARNHNENFDLSSYPPEIKKLVLELAPMNRP